MSCVPPEIVWGDIVCYWTESLRSPPRGTVDIVPDLEIPVRRHGYYPGWRRILKGNSASIPSCRDFVLFLDGECEISDGVVLTTLFRAEGGPGACIFGKCQPMVARWWYSRKYRAYGLFWLTRVFGSFRREGNELPTAGFFPLLNVSKYGMEIIVEFPRMRFAYLPYFLYNRISPHLIIPPIVLRVYR